MGTWGEFCNEILQTFESQCAILKARPFEPRKNEWIRIMG